MAVVLRPRRGGGFWVLVSRRPSGSALPDCWEFPGGKALPGEPAEACARREVEEETGIRVEAVSPLLQTSPAARGRPGSLVFLLCRYGEGVPEARGCRAVRWVGPENLEVYPFPDANRPILEWLCGPEEFLSRALGRGRNGTPANL